jgi:hypothetical protein
MAAPTGEALTMAHTSETSKLRTSKGQLYTKTGLQGGFVHNVGYVHARNEGSIVYPFRVHMTA